MILNAILEHNKNYKKIEERRKEDRRKRRKKIWDSQLKR
jgi:hypothetical protein